MQRCWCGFWMILPLHQACALGREQGISLLTLVIILIILITHGDAQHGCLKECVHVSPSSQNACFDPVIVASGQDSGILPHACIYILEFQNNTRRGNCYLTYDLWCKYANMCFEKQLLPENSRVHNQSCVIKLLVMCYCQ